uniref:Uncharacterized protein n=1 Tax=Nucleocytoviricota sp. TaxID=2809609 RepID=A0A9E8JWV3_9VIRU|nr:hypothetical protein [Nucleocytoviricota sp.]
MNDKFLTVKNPDGELLYCKNINENYDYDNYFAQNIYYFNKINLYSSFIKIIVFVDILSEFHIYSLYNLNNKCFLYFDLFIDLIALYSVGIFEKNLFIIYLLKYYFISILSIYSILLCNINIYNNYLIVSNNNTIIYQKYFLENYNCIYLNITTITNIIILSILQKFYNNIENYKNVINNVINLY